MGSNRTALLRRIEEALRTAHGDRMRGVVMFGSEANGTAEDDSDVDVLVLLDGPVRYADDLLANLAALEGMSRELERRISPKPIDADLFESDDSPLVRTARAEGLRL
jgi:predicted nucleotidyltransferase